MTGLVRCMGGGYCRHTSGTCTATASLATPDAVWPEPGAVELPAVQRDPADEVSAEAIAYGLFCLEAAVFAHHRAAWGRLDQRHRDLYLARARFVLSMAADEVPPVPPPAESPPEVGRG